MHEYRLRGTMFIFGQAWKMLCRHPLRSLLIVLVSAAIAMWSTFGGAVLQENHKARTETLDKQSNTAVIRPSSQLLETRQGDDSSWTEHYLSWSDYDKLASAGQTQGMQYKYTVAESVPVRESKSVQAITTGKTSDASADKTGGNLTLQSFYTAEAAQANEYGPYEVVEGKGLDYQNSLAQNVLISEALAKKNNLKVGSTITIGNPTDAKKTYEYTVVGIYRYTGNPDNAQGDDAKFAKDNRNNVLYTTYTTFAVNGFDTTKGKGWSIPDLNVVFTFQNRSDIDKFAAALKADLPKGFTVSSPTITHYMQSIEALGTLAGTTRIIMIVLWICGALALLGLVLLAALPRSNEIGMGMLVGLSKGRLAWQFMLETFMPTLVGLAVGLVLGACTANPLAGALGAQHDVHATGGLVWQVIWIGVLCSVALAIVAGLRVTFYRTIRLFESPYISDSADSED